MVSYLTWLLSSERQTLYHPTVKCEITRFMDTYSEQQQDGIKIMRHTYFRFDICDVPSEYAKEACEGKGFG